VALCAAAQLRLDHRVQVTRQQDGLRQFEWKRHAHGRYPFLVLLSLLGGNCYGHYVIFKVRWLMKNDVDHLAICSDQAVSFYIRMGSARL
jgi:hypothetical protein